MPESASHKKYMERYRTRKKQQKEALQTAEETVTAEVPWRTRRHATTRSDGTQTTDYLFERRNQLTLRSERGPLTDEDVALKREIEGQLRARGYLAPEAHSYYPCSCIPKQREATYNRA